jgi:thioredoxin 1
MATQVTTSAELAALVAKHKYVVVKYGAPWCEPCRRVAPGFAEIMAESDFDGVHFAEVDIDASNDLAKEQGANTIPNFHFWENGAYVSRIQTSDASKVRARLWSMVIAPPKKKARGE